jgi:hypothetical protein
MQTLVDVYWVAAIIAIVINALLMWQTLEHRRFVRSRVLNPSREPCTSRVAVFIACKGAEPELTANLRPLFEQDHNDFELVFVVESIDDAAVSVIRSLMGQYPGIGSRLIVAGLADDEGQKVHNLLAATKELGKNVRLLAFADADVRPPRDWLRLLTQRLNVEVAATGYRWFVPDRQTLANCLVSSVNAAVIPIMFPGLHRKIWGGSWAIRREVFEDSGLREAWRHTLSDDLVASNVVTGMKHRISVEPACIVASPIDITIGGMFSFVRRQYTIGRCYSPRLWAFVLAYCCAAQTIFLGGALLAVAGACLGASWTWQPAVATTLLYTLSVVRGWVRQQASYYVLGDRWADLRQARLFDIWLGPLSSVAICVCLVSSAIGRRIVWKQISYEMLPAGLVGSVTRLSEPPPAAQTVQRRAA